MVRIWHLGIDSRLFRPHEVPLLLGNPKKALKRLKWAPKVNFESLAKMMYDSDYAAECRKLNLMVGEYK